MVVGDVAEPGGHAGGGVEAGLFPGAPHGVEAEDGFGVAPPVGGPEGGAGIDGAAVDGAEEVAEELVDVGVDRPNSPISTCRDGRAASS